MLRQLLLFVVIFIRITRRTKQGALRSNDIPTPDQSVRLLQSMCDKFPSLYRHSLQDRPEKRVLLIRETGDNFRGADRRKIEQDSFSILNIKSLITSPPGQFVNGLWCGPESRKFLKGHLSGTYQELDDCVRNGLAVTLPDGRLEIFNVVVFYVADLAHKTRNLGVTHPQPPMPSDGFAADEEMERARSDA